MWFIFYHRDQRAHRGGTAYQAEFDETALYRLRFNPLNRFVMYKEESNPALDDDGQNITEEKGTILIVDDDKLVLKALEMTLQREGYDVMTAENGEQAINILNQHLPAIIICDQSLPGMNGMEVMQKAEELRPDAIRILLTGSQDVETAINAINIGHVSQYLTKPWRDIHLCKIVKTSLEKYKLIKENQILQKLIYNQHRKLKQTHASLRHELKLSGHIHEQMLLGKVPTNIPGFIIKTCTSPSKEVDGDFFEFYHAAPHVLDMVLGDVMGKGIAAALVGTAVKTQMIRFAMPFPFSQIYEEQTGWSNNLLKPEQIISHVHKSISKQLIDLEYFVALFYARFDLQYKTLTYLDCGSAKPIHYRSDKNDLVQLSGDNFPLGIVENPELRSVETTFGEGDIFVFYSDGISEARSPNNEFFGVERIMDLVRTNQDFRAEALVDIIRRKVLAFANKEKLDDDLTLIVIKIGFYERPDISKYSKTQFYCDLSQLHAVRNFVKRFIRKAPGDSARLASEMELVINEAFCNIVKHGTSDLNKNPIHISGELGEKGIIFEIKDKGFSFDPAAVNEPSFAGNRDTGYGWHIIKELSDKIIYTRKEENAGWNHLTIYKHYYFREGKMNINHKTNGKVLVITPDGECLDAKEAVEFKEKVVELINNNNMNGVVFDLDRVQFIDSSGMGSLLSVLRLLNTRGGDLKLSRMNKQIRTMFELVKMHKIFEIYNSTEEAVVSFHE